MVIISVILVFVEVVVVVVVVVLVLVVFVFLVVYLVQERQWCGGKERGRVRREIVSCQS